MAIRNRHGVYDKFIPKKLVPGEFAFVRSGDPNAKDGKSIYAAFDAGDTKRLATYEDMVENISNASKEIVEGISSELVAATDRANTSAGEAETAAKQATTAAEEAKEAIAGSKSPVYKSDGFPVTGEVGRLYVDDTVNPRVIYTWDDEDGYIVTGGGDSGASELSALNTQTLGYSKKNLIPYPYYETTKTSNGITWTDNGDGTVTTNGTASGMSTFHMTASTFEEAFKFESGKKYVVSGSPDTGQEKRNLIIVRQLKSDGTWVNVTEGGNGECFVAEDDCTYSLRLCVVSSVTASNIVFKPMIRKAEILDDTWEPYVPDVDKRLKSLESTISELGNPKGVISDEFDPEATYATGDYAVCENVLYKFTGDKSAGEWDESVVSATKVDAELQALKEATDELNSKMDLVSDLINDDTAINFVGIWTPLYWNTCRLTIPLQNADKYDITIKYAFYADNATENSIINTVNIVQVTPISFEVNTTNSAAASKPGIIIFTVQRKKS